MNLEPVYFAMLTNRMCGEAIIDPARKGASFIAFGVGMLRAEAKDCEEFYIENEGAESWEGVKALLDALAFYMPSLRDVHVRLDALLRDAMKAHMSIIAHYIALHFY